MRLEGGPYVPAGGYSSLPRRAQPWHVRGGGANEYHIQEVTGKPPESFETTARRYIASPDLIVPGLRVGTKLQALIFMGKMMLARVPDLDR